MSRNSVYTDETNLDDFVLSETKDFLLKEIPELNDVEWGEIGLDIVAANVSGIDRSVKITTIKKFLSSYAGVSDKVIAFQQNKKFRNEILKPIISLFRDLGLDTCRNIRKFLATNPTESAIKLRKKYLDAINDIKERGTDADIAYMESQLASLSDPSVLEDLIPTEGVTFLYKNKLYKLTGIFQVLNNICNLLKYKKE